MMLYRDLSPCCTYFNTRIKQKRIHTYYPNPDVLCVYRKKSSIHICSSLSHFSSQSIKHVSSYSVPIKTCHDPKIAKVFTYIIRWQQSVDIKVSKDFLWLSIKDEHGDVSLCHFLDAGQLWRRVSNITGAMVPNKTALHCLEFCHSGV